MDKIQPFLNELLELFQEMIEKRNNPSQSLLDSIKKQGQFLAACFKRIPEVSLNEKVIELLALYAAPSSGEHPKIYPTSSSLVELCLKSIPSNFLTQMWDLTADIGLCEIILKTTNISSESVFQKFCQWIEEPNADVTFSAHFLAILGTTNGEEIPEESVTQIIPFLIDSSPLRSSLASLVIRSFTSISQTAAYVVIASWLQCRNRRIQSAYNCRKVLELAPISALNYAATLCLEFPAILCILPPKTMGYQALTSITLHRIITLAPDSLVPFVEMCDVSVRNNLYEKTLKKEQKDAADVVIYPPLRLFDASFDPEIRVKEVFDFDKNNDLVASAAWFARMTVKTKVDISDDIKRQIYNILKAPKERMKDVDQRDFDIDPIILTNEKLTNKNVGELRGLIENPLV